MHQTDFLMKNGLEQMRRIDGVTTIFLRKGIRNVFKISVHILIRFIVYNWLQSYEKTDISTCIFPSNIYVFNFFYKFTSC